MVEVAAVHHLLVQATNRLLLKLVVQVVLGVSAIMEVTDQGGQDIMQLAEVVLAAVAEMPPRDKVAMEATV